MVNYVKPGDIPNVMQKLRRTISLDAGSDFGANSGSEFNIGTIHFDEILQVLDTLNNANYTFKVDDGDDDPFTFTNLVIREWVDGAIQNPYLMRYKLDSGQVATFISNNFSLEYFQGTVTQQFIGQDFKWNKEYGVNLEEGYTGDDLSPCPPTIYNIGGGGGTNDGTDGGGPGPGNADISGDGSRCYYDLVLNPCPYQVTTGVTNPEEHGPESCMNGEGPGTTWTFSYVCFDDPYMTFNTDDPCPEPDGDIGILIDDGFIDLEAELWEEEICEKDNFKNNECVYGIWELMNAQNVAFDILKKFKGDNPIADLCIDIKDLGSGSNGNAGPSGINSDATITININSRFLYRPKLSIARTILHELIHAELHAMIIEAGGKSALESYAANHDDEDPFVVIWNYIKEFGIYSSDPPNTGWQHEYMADNYINYMVEGLKKLHPVLSSQSFINYWDGQPMSVLDTSSGSNIVSSTDTTVTWNLDDFLKALAWSSLKETTEWDSLDQSLKDLYNTYISSHEVEVLANKCS